MRETSELPELLRDVKADDFQEESRMIPYFNKNKVWKPVE